MGLPFVVLTVIAGLLSLGVPSMAPAAAASGNGLGPKDCAHNGWKALETSKNASFNNELGCVLYSGLGGSLRRKQTIAFVSTAPVPPAVGVTYRPSATATSGLPTAITLDSTSRGCTIGAGLVTFTAVGTCVLDADQAGNGTYGPAPRVKQTVAVVKAAQAIQFTSAPPSPALVGATYRPSAVSTSGLPVTITRDGSSTGCSLTSGLVTFTTAGSCVLDADQSGNASYLAAPQVQQILDVTKNTQTVSFTSTVPSSAVVGGSYTPTAAATSGLPVAITVDAASTGCTLSSGSVSFTGAGTCVLDAAQAGNTAFDPATQVTQSIEVVRNPQSVSFTSTAPAPATVGGSYTPTATATSGLAPVISLDPTSTGCTLSAGLLSFTSAGTCVLDADQTGDTAYDPATQVTQSIEVVRSPQSVSFTSTAPAPATVGGSYTPTATATSGLPAVISLDPTSTGCTLSAGLVSFTSAGTCVLDVDQAGDTTYDPATQVTQSIQVLQQSQTIGFTSTAPASPTITTTYTPTATATSGLAVAITLDATSTGCSLAGGVVTFTAVGACVVDGDQAGDTTFAPAAQVQQAIAVTAPATPVAVDDSATVDKLSGPTTLDVLANDTNPGTIQSVTQPANGTVTITNGGANLTYAPNPRYCNNPGAGDPTSPSGPDTFTYTLTGGSTATVSMTVNPVRQQPHLVSPITITQVGGQTTVRMVTVFKDSVANKLVGILPNWFDATGYTDPSSCAPGTETLDFHWVISYPSISPYTDFGITGYRTPILTMDRNSLLNQASPPVRFTLTGTSRVSGLSDTNEIWSNVAQSSLSISVFNQCQGVTPGPCTIAAAGPATDPT